VGKYALADDDRGVWTSNGIANWTKSLLSQGPMADVATNGNLCVAVGKAPGNLYTSPDGLNWKVRPSGTTASLAGAAYAQGEFVVVGENGTILTSTDTATWTPQAADTTALVTSVAGNGKIFVAVTGNGSVLARLPTPTFATATLTLLTTPKTPQTAPKAATNPPAPPSPLGNWTTVSSGETTTYWQTAWLRGTFVSVGNVGAIVTSPDGITWTKQASKTHEHFFGVTANKDLYVVVGDHGAIYTSPDLKDWTARSSHITERIFTVVWTGAQFIALAMDTVITSPDGVTWLARPVLSENGFHHGVWTGSQLIMTTANSVAYSPDGVRWITTLRMPDKMFDIATDGSLYVAVGTTSGSVYLSLNGQTWTQRPIGTRESLSAITWTGDQFVAGGANDTLAASPEGMNWTVYHTGTGLQANTVAGHDGTIVIGTYTGEMLVNKNVATVAAPEISLAPGAPGSVPQVILTCATPGARIYYTLDGAEPNTLMLPYTAPFTPAAGATIKARAYKDGLPASELVKAQFTPGP
jgi:hypothetical protein